MIRWIPLLLMLPATCQAAPAAFRVTEAGSRLTVRTDRAEAVFQGPDMVGLRNLITGETYTSPSDKLPSGLARIRVKDAGDADLNSGRWASSRDGAAYTAMPTAAKPGSFTVHVSADKGQIVLRCEGTLDRGGVHAITWGATNLSLDTTQAVLPVKAGRILRAESNAASEEFEYPTHWEAQFAVVSGRRGSALIYSTDQDARFKRLSFLRAGRGYQLIFETQNQAPFAGLRSVESVEWRVDCFGRSWRAAVDAYKQDMRERSLRLYSQPKVVRDQKWVRSIRAVVRVGNYQDTAILDELARRLDAPKTLLYFHDWRRDGYDVNYPDYTGRPGLREFTAYARKLGFRVMFHVDLPGVTPSHPVFERLKRYQVKDAMSLAPVGWLWDKDVPQRFAFINPASSEFRRVFVEAMRGIVHDYGADMVHLDVSAPMWNDSSGLIEGLNYAQGSIRLHCELLEAIPELALGGESVNELLAPFEHFVQRWAWPCSLDPHPVCDYLFGDITRSYGYLGMPNPDQSPTDFLRHVKPYESQGVLPTLVIDSLSELGPRKPLTAKWLKVLRAWQDHDLRPDWSTDWPASVIFSLRGSRGARAVIERTSAGVRMVCDRKVLYERVEGVDRVKTHGHIAGHAAYLQGEIIGLNPLLSYWIDDGPPDLSAPHISAITGDAMIEESRTTDELVSFRIAAGQGRLLLDLAREIGNARAGVVFGGKRESLDQSATFSRTEGQVNGAPMTSVFAHPPWKPRPGAGPGQTFGIYSVKVPSATEGRCLLLLSAGISDGARETDGVTFIVKLDGAEAFRRHVTSPMPWQRAALDLSAHAGRELDIELITDPGPAGNTSWDHALWGEPRVVLRRDSDASSVEVALAAKPLGVVMGGGPGDDEARVVTLRAEHAGESVLADGIGAPAPLGVFFYYTEPAEISLPLDLCDTEFTAGLIHYGAYRPGSAWGGGTVGAVSIGGRTLRAISGHPPGYGRTALTWLLRLPPDCAAKLAFAAGIRENASTDGVGFLVRVNGVEKWTRSAVAPVWWDAEVDLSEHAGRVVVLELVTDSLGEAFCDWAMWANPRLEPATN